MNKLLKVVPRHYSNASLQSSEAFVYNRNPRNLERLCIARKPEGWQLEKPGRTFWHKIEILRTARHVSASVVHFSGAVPVSCSTKEWAIRKHLYSTNDMAAYINIGRVMGVRCLETGITEMSCFLERKDGGKIDKFLKEMEKSGVVLTELPVYKNPQPSHIERPEKPWNVIV